MPSAARIGLSFCHGITLHNLSHIGRVFLPEPVVQESWRLDRAHLDHLGDVMPQHIFDTHFQGRG